MNKYIRSYIQALIVKVAKGLPSCPAAIYQTDEWQEHAMEILECLCTDLSLYESKGKQNDN